MVRGDYTIQDMEGSKQARKDGSYKSCVVTMFIVFLLCVIIILIVWRMKPDGDDKYLPADEAGDAEYINAHDRKHVPSKHTTKSPGTSTTHRIFETTEPPPVTTKKIQTTVTQKFAKIKAQTPKTTTSVPTTQKHETTETPTTLLDVATTHTTIKYGKIINQENHTTSVPRTTDSTTVKQMKITVIPHQTSSTRATPNVLSTTTESTVGLETETTDIPFGRISVTENDYATALSEGSSDATSKTPIILHALGNDSSKTTPGSTVETTYETTDETDGGTSEMKTATTGSIPVATTKFQNVTTYPTTVPTTTTEKSHLPLVILYTKTSVSTTTDDVTESSTSVSEFNTTTSEVVPHITNSGYLATTENDEKTVDYVTSQIPTDYYSTTITEGDETTTNAQVSHNFVAITESQNTTSYTSTTQPPIIKLISTTVTSGDVESTTDDLISHVDASTSKSTTVQSQVVISTSTPLEVTQQGTTTDNDLSLVSVTVTNSQNTAVTTDNITVISSIEAVSESETTADDDSTTPAVVQTTNNNKDEICQTSECKVLSSRILSLMNHSMDPCDNFYEFACGGLRDNHALLQEDPSQDVWNRIATAVREVNSKSNSIYQKFRHFYDQCVDYENTVNHTERLELARKVIGDIDKMYNSLEWKQADANFSLTDILVKLFHFNSAPLFDVSVDVNHHNTNKFQLKLTVPRSKTKLQLESISETRCKSHIYSADPHSVLMTEVYEKNYFQCIKNVTEYFNTMEKAIKEMELYGNTDAYNISQNIGAIRFFIEFDIFSSLEVVNTWELRTNIQEKKLTLMTLEELANSYPEVEWEVLFGALLNEAVDKNTEVQVYFVDYFDKLFGQLKYSLSNTTARLIIHNGLLAMLAHDLYVDLIKPRPCNREEYCLGIASGLMEDVSSSLYISTFTSKELSDKEHELVTLFDQLKNVLNDEINNADWFDDESRSSMVDKLHNMKIMADGGRAILNDSNYLKNQLSDQDLSVSNNYFENAIQLQRRYRKQIYYLMTYDADPTLPEVIWTFFHLPYGIYPKAIYQLNTVVIPYGMIGLWKLTNKLPSFVWKARIGNEIARQIVHNFDTTGIQFGTKGKANDFLQDPAKDVYYDEYELCEQAFDTYVRTWTNQENQIYHYTVNSARTMNEHFTDNSALWLTHKLFNKTAKSEPVLPWLDMNHDELYLLFAAQEFCAKAELLDYTVMMFETEKLPPYLRVENMIVNSQEFGYVYNCPVGGKQNPNVKCPPFPRIPEDSSHHSSASGLIPVV